MNRQCLLLVLSFILSVPAAEAQVVYNAGKMTVGAPVSGGGASLYIEGGLQVVGNSNINHVGKTILTGDLVNDVKSGHVFTGREGIFEFGGTTVQRIGGTADKAVNYIEFPKTVVINNRNTAYNNDSAVVIIHPDMGVTVKDLTLTKGRLVLDSKVNGEKTDIAHLLVESGGNVTYARTNDRNTRHQDGIIQVNLAMGDNANRGGLTGFSSPFETLYADYFFFNFLSVPTSETFFSGNKDIWNLNPKMEMPAGRGYVIGQGIVPHGDPYYNSHLNGVYSGAAYADVAKDRFSFARLFAPQSITQFVAADTGIPDSKKFSGEKLNTSTVTVPLEEGYNYLGNPFTVPLDLTSFVNDPNTGIWGAFSTYEMEPAFYLLSPGSKGEYAGNDVFSFTASYLVGQKVGSTADSKMIAPMQMFAVKKRTAGSNNFKIAGEARTHGKASFLRSSDVAADDSPVNELLIETKDAETGGFDRLCIVFRSEATLDAGDLYDAEKLFNTTGGVNQIYTRSSDQKKLTTNVIPETTPQLAMYFEPSSTLQQVTLTADRLQSLQTIRQVILEDKQTGSKTDLTLDPVYTFASSPTDRSDRFILHFRSNPVNTESLSPESGRPSAYYSDGTIYVNGLRESDRGSDISLYNMQGQQLLRQRIAEINPCLIRRYLNTGIYLLKIEGNPHVIRLAP